MSSRWLVFVVLSVLLVAGLGLMAVGAIYDVYNYPLRVLVSLGPELAGAAVTYGLFELFIGRRQRTEAEKKELISGLGSGDNNETRVAAGKLKQRGWLANGYLREAKFSGANLRRVELIKADLTGANLRGADLMEAILAGAILRGADLTAADLRGADLTAADLCGARLEGAALDEDTTLPDRTKGTQGTRMERFTDPNHPDFWHSPDYRDKDGD